MLVHLLCVAAFHSFYLSGLRLALFAKQLSHSFQLAHHIIVTSPSCFVTGLLVCVDFGLAKGSLRFLFRVCALQILLK
jgi:hypothetical protein